MFYVVIAIIFGILSFAELRSGGRPGWVFVVTSVMCVWMVFLAARYKAGLLAPGRTRRRRPPRAPSVPPPPPGP